MGDFMDRHQQGFRGLRSGVNENESTFSGLALVKVSDIQKEEDALRNMPDASTSNDLAQVGSDCRKMAMEMIRRGYTFSIKRNNLRTAMRIICDNGHNSADMLVPLQRWYEMMAVAAGAFGSSNRDTRRTFDQKLRAAVWVNLLNGDPSR